MVDRLCPATCPDASVSSKETVPGSFALNGMGKVAGSRFMVPADNSRKEELYLSQMYGMEPEENIRFLLFHADFYPTCPKKHCCGAAATEQVNTPDWSRRTAGTLFDCPCPTDAVILVRECPFRKMERITIGWERNDRCAVVRKLFHTT